MSVRSKVSCLAIAAVLAAVTMGAHPVLAASDDVAATVNGDKIYKKDVLNAIKTLPVKAEDKDKVYPIVVNQMVNEKLVDKQINSKKIEESDDYKKRLSVMKDQLAKQIYIEQFLKDKVTDAKVSAEYDKFKEQNTGKEEVHARHIIVKTEDEAKQVIKDLDGGANFADLAKKRSSGPTAQNGGDLGYFTKDEMIPEFTTAAFALKPGTYTKTPVHTQFGWHVIYVEDKRARVVPSEKDVDAAIRNKLGQDALTKMVLDMRAKADIKEFDQNGKPVDPNAAAAAGGAPTTAPSDDSDDKK